MSSGSFWSRFKDIDAEAGVDAMLAFLDAYAELDPVQEHKRRATEALALQPGDRVLDLGCGTGVDLGAMHELARPGEVLGVDVSARAVEAANERFAHTEGVSAVVGDAEALPLPDAVFDACRADRTLQHVRDPQRALAELRRVLRPGGRLVVLEVASGIDVRGASEVLTALGERMVSERERMAWLPLMLPVLLPRAGFAEVRMTSHETTSEDPDVIAAMVAVREIADSAVPGDDARDTLEQLRDGAARGEAVLRLRSVCLAATAA